MFESRHCRVHPLWLLTLALCGAWTTAHGQAAASERPARRIVVLPALGSAPETGFQFGITTFGTFQPADPSSTRPSVLLASAIRTTKAQTRLSLEGEHWSAGNRRRLAGSLLWQRFPLPFYGIGPDTPDTARTVFTPQGIEANASVQQLVRGAVYVTAGVRFLDQSITTDSAGAAALGTLEGATGGRSTEWSVGLLRDTRDNLFAPWRGSLVQVTYGRAVDGLLSDFAYGRTRFDARSYRDLGGRWILAAQLQLTGLHGRPPFDRLASVGSGEILRGYTAGRYRDTWMGAAQLEMRSPVRRQFQGVAFAGAGLVAPRFQDLGTGPTLPTYGLGARYLLDPARRTGIRLDVGRGRDGASGLYIGFNQAF